MTEYEARGEWLGPYSIRDTFSIRAHGIVKDDKDDTLMLLQWGT